MIKSVSRKLKNAENQKKILIGIIGFFFALGIILFLQEYIFSKITPTEEDSLLLIQLKEILGKNNFKIVNDYSIQKTVNLISPFLAIFLIPTLNNFTLLKIYVLLLIMLIFAFSWNLQDKIKTEFKLIGITPVLLSGVTSYFLIRNLTDIIIIFLHLIFMFVFLIHREKFHKSSSYFYLFLISGISLIIGSQLSILLIISLAFFFVSYNKVREKETIEFFLFFILFYFWYYIMILKIPMQVFHYIPLYSTIKFLRFQSIASVLTNPGYILILLFGFTKIGKSFFKKKEPSLIFMNTYLIILVLFSLVIRKIDLPSLFLCLLIISINFSREVEDLYKFLKKTKLEKYRSIIISIIISYVFISLSLGSIYNNNNSESQETQMNKQIETISKYINEKGNCSEVIISPLKYSNLIHYYTEKKIVSTKYNIFDTRKEEFEKDYEDFLISDPYYRKEIFIKYDSSCAILEKENYKEKESKCFRKKIETKDFILLKDEC